MAGVTVGEVVDRNNPLLFFPFQIDGKLFDVAELKREVFHLPVGGARTSVVAEATLDLTTTTGVKVDTGVFAAGFDATGLTPGTHEIEWTFKRFSLADPEEKAFTRFEVLDANKFASGQQYVGYADSAFYRAKPEFASCPVGDMQVAIDQASREIVSLTGRRFGPHYATFKLDTKKTRNIFLQEPIIGVNRVEIESGVNGVTATKSEISLDGLRMYARHLNGGPIDPDDRDDPRIEIERFEGIIFQSLDFFPKGPQVTIVTGVFGYTEADGSPFGRIPLPLTRAIGILALRQNTDFFASNPTVTEPGSITMMKTRDQAIRFDSAGGSAGGGGRSGRAAYGGLTGDDVLDRILIPYVRPPHMRAV
jgi:hypothetical protein